MNYFDINFSTIYNISPKHLIHIDIHPGNMNFRDKNLSGMFDFEMVVNGVRIFDPCCFKDCIISYTKILIIYI